MHRVPQTILHPYGRLELGTCLTGGAASIEPESGLVSCGAIGEIAISPAMTISCGIRITHLGSPVAVPDGTVGRIWVNSPAAAGNPSGESGVPIRATHMARTAHTVHLPLGALLTP